MTVDEFTKIASLIGAVIVGGAAAFTYYDTANRELAKPFNDAQLALCKEASDTAAALASPTSLQQVGARGPADKIEGSGGIARARFEQLFWGSLAIVENQDVASKMVEFRNLVLKSESDPNQPVARGALQQAAIRIAHACRDLVSKTWQLKLPSLVGVKQSMMHLPLDSTGNSNRISST
jgi:hypothetical protein